MDYTTADNTKAIKSQRVFGDGGKSQGVKRLVEKDNHNSLKRIAETTRVKAILQKYRLTRLVENAKSQQSLGHSGKTQTKTLKDVFGEDVWERQNLRF